MAVGNTDRVVPDHDVAATIRLKPIIMWPVNGSTSLNVTETVLDNYVGTHVRAVRAAVEPDPTSCVTIKGNALGLPAGEDDFHIFQQDT